MLQALGVLWGVVELSSFFSDEFEDAIKPYGLAVPLAAIILGVLFSWPRTSHRYSLKGRDAVIEIIIGSVFKGKGEIVLGSNTTFDTSFDNDLISPTSMQGAYTLRNFKGDVIELDRLLEEQLQLQGVSGDSVDKPGKKHRYPIGTVCRIQGPRETSYWLAIADITPNGIANSNFQNLKDALPKLWEYLAVKGARQDIRMPVLGSGFSRIRESREDIIKEIVRSFVAACAEATFCERLSIYIRPEDVTKHDIDLDELKRFLECQCLYSETGQSSGVAFGSPLS